jgi:hypothetical protein
VRETHGIGIARTGGGKNEGGSRFGVRAAWCKKQAFFSRRANSLQEAGTFVGVKSRALRERKTGLSRSLCDRCRENNQNCVFDAAHPAENAWRREKFHPDGDGLLRR